MPALQTGCLTDEDLYPNPRVGLSLSLLQTFPGQVCDPHPTPGGVISSPPPLPLNIATPPLAVSSPPDWATLSIRLDLSGQGSPIHFQERQPPLVEIPAPHMASGLRVPEPQAQAPFLPLLSYSPSACSCLVVLTEPSRLRAVQT